MSPQTQGKKILFVEDDLSYRTLILSILRKAGFRCIFCVNGDEALKKLEQEKFDLLITDYLIPGPDGIEVVRRMRSNNINIPALIITNYPSEELNEDSKTLEGAIVMSKSLLNASTIKEIVQDILSA